MMRTTSSFVRHISTLLEGCSFEVGMKILCAVLPHVTIITFFVFLNLLKSFE